jgi:DNA-binding transcriptional ArsR family regulator
MVGPEEETYSIMFTSLKHPARRKILRLLAVKPKTFSKILEELAISSSHLTYHLENLGELVIKTEDGTYKLSTFGEAAVTAMREVEEVPIIKSKSPLSLPLAWKALFGVFMISLIILAGFSYTQHMTLNQISTDKTFTFLRDVIQLDMPKYYTRLVSNTLEYSSDLGGIIEEFLKYTLISDESELDVDFRFRNQTLSRFRLNIIEGTPFFAQKKPDNIIEQTDDLLQRYKNYSGVSYLEPMRNMLNSVNGAENVESISGDIKLVISTEGKDTEIQWWLVANGIDFQVKGVALNFDNGLLEMLTDGWFLFNVGSTELNIFQEEAINIALNGVKDYSWTANGVVVSDFNILEEQVTAIMYPHLRGNNLELIPVWVVNLPLDKIYPGNVDVIVVGIWGDTGEITEYRTISAG